MAHPDIGIGDDLISNPARGVKGYRMILRSVRNAARPDGGRGWPLMGALLTLLLLTACAAPPPGHPPIQPALIRDNLLTLANREWQAFGQQTIYIDAGRERIDPVGTWEDDAAGSVLVTKYWRSVGETFTGYDCDKPWSAAFISWLMQAAGVPPTVFPPSMLHADYLRAILAASDGSETRALFLPHEPATYAPRPGDLICARRGPVQIARFDDVPADAQLHCDLVVENQGGRLVSIGGNVRNSVSKTIRPVDASGRLGSATDRPWFLAVELRVPGS